MDPADRAYQDPLRPCLDCQTPTRAARCPSCRTARAHVVPMASSSARGYDGQWRRLSERARRLQPWCSDCHAINDLTTDHSPAAWQARAAGRPITLDLIAVVCRSCNSKRGAARGLDSDQGTHTDGQVLTTPFPQDLPDTHRSRPRRRVVRGP